MSEALDNTNVLNQKDPSGALKVAAEEYQQALFDAKVWNAENDGREITGVVFVGMGGSALGASIVKVWLRSELTVPFEVIRAYDLPKYVTRNTLVIASSYSGNTEETLSALEQAEHIGAQLGIIAATGQLIDIAGSYDIAHVSLPTALPQRMTVILGVRATVALLENFGVLKPGKLTEIGEISKWLEQESAQWTANIPTADNYAKQLAEQAVGKTAVFYGGALTAPLAYKWKITFNETGKNMAFWNEYSEANHNEFMGWTSHPIEKPYAVFDLVSNLEHSQILKRFELTDKLLSGKRPKAVTIQLKGETLIAQLLWGTILADFASIYLAVLNGVDPTPVALIERLKKELS